MKKFKKILAGSTAAALTLSLAACGTSEPTDTTTEETGELSGTVTMWTASLSGEPFDTYFANLEAEFESLHPDLDVIIEDIPQGEIEQKVLTSLTSNDVPDVVNLNPHFMSNIAAQGGLLDLTNELSEGVDTSFLTGPFESGKYDGGLYALPWYLTTTVSWYNGASLEAAGVSEMPTTPMEIYETAKKVTDATGKPAYYPVINDGNAIMEKMVTLANGEQIVKDGVASFASNAAILEYFEVAQKMYAEGIIPQEAAEGSIKTGQELYMAGNTAMIEGGVTFLGPVESGAPEVYNNSKAGQPLAQAEAPVNVAVMNFAVPTKTDNKAAAVALAEFVTNADNQLEFSKTAGTVLPATIASLEDSYFTEPGDSPKALGMLQASESLERAQVLIPPTENSADLRDATKTIFVKTLQGDLAPQDALTELEAAWTSSFEKTGETVSF
ncbi:MAG: ABC transporter substrate-binding protein [Culicoidibacterales bacterium]